MISLSIVARGSVGSGVPRPAPQGCTSMAWVLTWVLPLQGELFMIAYSSGENAAAPCASQLERQEGAEARRLRRKARLRLEAP